MSIGAGIFLITAGAILAFGIRDDSGTVDLNVVGVVIMLGGGAGIWLSFYITNRRRRVETQALDPAVEEEYRTVQENSAQYGEVSGTGRSSRAAELNAPFRPVAVTRDIPRNAGQTADTATERHVDLDPAASGLHTPTPNRTVPVTSRAPAPSPGISPDPQEPRSESWRRRLLNRVRHGL